MKKLLLILFPLIVALAAFLVVVLILNKNPGKGALQVTANPVSDVYLDGKLIGKTPLCKCEASDMIATGEHTVKVVPAQDDLSAFEEKITIYPSVLTVVDRTFSQGVSSHGSIIDLAQIPDKKDVQLSVVSFPDKVDVLMDSNPVGQTPLLLKNLTESDHEIKLIKEGYKDKSIRIRTVAGFRLEVTAYLGVMPVSTESAQTTASSSATLKVVQVLILDTPTGFLRVREKDSLSSPQIGEVKPGEKYDLISEESGWIEIKLSDGKTGWVSSQYAKKE